MVTKSFLWSMLKIKERIMKVVCHTNLDLRSESWPTELPAVPTVGTRIQSKTIHNGKFQLEPEVCQITYKYLEPYTLKGEGEWVPRVELHMTSWQKSLRAEKEGACPGSITAFYEWYARCLGVSVGCFI